MNQQNKALVWNYWQLMNDAKNVNLLYQVLHPNIIWHGFQPLRHLSGSAEICSQFWQPLLTAIPDLIRRPYIFIGGHFDGNDWVCGTGDFIGSFANNWPLSQVTVPASGSSVHFRFGEFCKVEDGQITEIRIIIDLPQQVRQAGINGRRFAGKNIKLFTTSKGQQVGLQNG